MSIVKKPQGKQPSLKDILDTKSPDAMPASNTKAQMIASTKEIEVVQLNVRIPIHLHSKARIKALEKRVQIKDVIAELLEQYKERH